MADGSQHLREPTSNEHVASKRPRLDQHRAKLAELTNLARAAPPNRSTATDAATTCDELRHGCEPDKAGSHGVRSPCDAGNAAADPSAAHGSRAAAASRWPRGVANFYGTQHGSSRQTAVELRIHRFLQGVKRRMLPSVPYSVFPQQAAAFEVADSHTGGHDLRIFSVERGARGARLFIATTYEEFWGRYRRLDGGRHFYEIVREGQPCHLYFDLEFRPEVNAGLDGDALVDKLLADVATAAQQHFGLSPACHDVLELDSTTPQKFSRHLVVRFPGAVFHSNRDVGALVAQLLGPDPLSGPYAVMKDAAGARTCFVDCSVYSRNRAFRLYLSSKFGKQAVLQPTGRLQPGAASQRDVFMQSLICNVPPDAQLLRCCPLEDAGSPTWQSVKSRRQPAGCQHRCQQGAGLGGLQALPPPSPIPAIDAYLASMCSVGGSQGYVRSWTRVDSSVLLYGIGGNRWCGNVGRQHKRNGIYIVVDLRGTWWQKCFDCRSYRSETMPLPPGIVPAPQPCSQPSGQPSSQHSGQPCSQPSGPGPQPSQNSPFRSPEGVLACDDSPGDSEAAMVAAADEAEAEHAALCSLLDWESATLTKPHVQGSKLITGPCDS